MKQDKQFKPKNLRVILVGLLIIIPIAAAAAFYWGLSQVRDYSVKVDHRLADADASGLQIQGLQTLKTQLDQSSTLIDKANQVFVTPDNYQSRALSDVQNYAIASGISIAKAVADTSGGGHSIIVTLKEPVRFSQLIAFLNNIEGNLPKLQVSSITLGHVDGGSATSVSVSDIKIDVSVR